MSKTTAPFMSLAASGKFADALVASRWKGIPYMRQYIIPANPRTAQQIAQRAQVTGTVRFWRSNLTDAVMRTGWNQRAGFEPSPMSGFNSYTSNTVQLLDTVANPSIGSSVESLVDDGMRLHTLNWLDGAQGNEVGNFEIYAGPNPAKLVYLTSQALVNGYIQMDSVEPGVHPLFIAARKDGYWRTGITKLRD